MDDFGHVLHMALEWQISVHVSHYFYPFSVSICLTASCSLILTFAPLKFSSFPSPNSSIMCPSTSLFLHEFLLHIKNSTPTPLFFFCSHSHSLPLPLSPLSVCPSLFHVHAHLSSGVSCCPVGFWGGDRWRRESEMKRQTEREERGKGKRTARERECDRKREREVERGSEIFLIHRDRLRFRGNVVSIVTALLRMPLVRNKKRNATHRWCGARTHIHGYTQTYQSPTCVYTICCYTNKHTHKHST